jgi:hypothetical protein
MILMHNNLDGIVTGPEWNATAAKTEAVRLTAPGVLGVYNQVEVTEVFAAEDGHSTPLNVFSILVAEEDLNAHREPRYLNSERIKLKALKGWVFGVKRYSRPVEEMVLAIGDLSCSGTWALSGEQLQLGKLAPVPDRFIPPDSLESVPLNRVLKNNFWNGSHVLEWADTQKAGLHPLMDRPESLQELSEAVQQCVSIRLASLSDRLGNVLVQLPVTALMSRFTKARDSGDFIVKVAWHPRIAPRPLRVACEIDFDGVISGYTSSDVRTPETPLRMPLGPGSYRAAIWDEEHHLVLAATGLINFASAASFTIRICEPEPRIFDVQDKEGPPVRQRITLQTVAKTQTVGTPQQDDTGGWTHRRIYKEELSRLTSERHFVQYKPAPGQEPAEQDRALRDLRFLLNRYGQAGAWLWDPFLSAHDILDTLFHCVHSDVVLRALTEGQDIPDSHEGETRADFATEQRTILASTPGNLRGLRLEYRIRIGPAGWRFHDRFLIFPATADRGALAWSLGTSVNSLGKQHHILQQVDDGQRIMDAFLDLWDRLNGPEHLIWKTP